MLNALIPFWILLLFLIYLSAAAWLIRHKKAMRQLRSPIDLKLLRLPGETARKKVDELLETMVDQLLYGALAATILMVSPVLVLMWMPTADQKWLLFSSAFLFVAVSVFYLNKVVKIGMERANYRLGSAGEREVAGHLQVLNAKGNGVQGWAFITWRKGR